MRYLKCGVALQTQWSIKHSFGNERNEGNWGVALQTLYSIKHSL